MVQVNNTPITVRVKFYKKGNLQYISHLDLVRTMMKIIVRAKLPLWYTEGFNPKPKLTFAAPLSIGTESECEFMDIRLTEKMPAEEVMRRLNANMTREMQAISAYYPSNKLTDLAWLGYSIEISSPHINDEVAESCINALALPTLTVSKKTKSGEAMVDIKPLIKSADVSCSENQLSIKCVLSANPSSFLNPEYLVKVLKEKCGILSDEDISAEGYSILRTDAYRSDMTEFS